MDVSENGNRKPTRWLAACILLGVILVLPACQPAAEGDEQDVSKRFEAWIAEMEEKIESGLESGKIGKNEAWARWWNFHYGDFRPKLLAASEDGDIGKDAAAKLWWAIETAEFSARVDAMVARGVFSEEEGRKRLEAFLATNNPIVFEALGDLFVLDADRTVARMIDRLDSEIKQRSRVENRREVEGLIESYRRAKEAGDQDRANELALEIDRIQNALGLSTFDIEVEGHVFVYDLAEPSLRVKINSMKARMAKRSSDENRAEVKRLTEVFAEARAAKDESKIRFVALELLLTSEAQGD